MLKIVENIQIEKTLVRLLKEKENFQKGRSTVSANTIFELMNERYQEANKALTPLREALNNDIQVVNIYFSNISDGEISIIVNYLENGELKEFIISQDFIDEIEIVPGLDYQKQSGLYEKNKELFIKSFDKLSSYNFEHSLEIPTSSRLFKIFCNLEKREIRDIQNKWLTIIMPYQESDKKTIICSNPRIREYLRTDVNVPIYLENFRVYEDNIPPFLKKR